MVTQDLGVNGSRSIMALPTLIDGLFEAFAT